MSAKPASARACITPNCSLTSSNFAPLRASESALSLFFVLNSSASIRLFRRDSARCIAVRISVPSAPPTSSAVTITTMIYHDDSRIVSHASVLLSISPIKIIARGWLHTHRARTATAAGASAAATGSRYCARLTTAVRRECSEHGEHAPRLAPAVRAGRRLVNLAHRAALVKAVAAGNTGVFVDGHCNLSGCNVSLRMILGLSLRQVNQAAIMN